MERDPFDRAREKARQHAGSGGGYSWDHNGAGHFSDSSDSSGSPWGDIIELGSSPPPPPFPPDLLPDPFRRLVEEGAEALNTPPDYLAVPLLVMAGGALGATRALAITDSHVQRAALYAAVVGPPASAKSPALKVVTAPAHERQANNVEMWRVLMEVYEEKRQAYERNKKKKQFDEGDVVTKPRRPILSRLVVSDTTSEALAPILLENPRGVVLVRDELTAWVASMNAYRDKGRGADRQFWLSVWDGTSAEVDRKKDHDKGPIIVRHPFVGVVGGMTPSGLRTVRGDMGGRRADDDGFIDRILFSYPLPTRARDETWASIGRATAEQFKDAMDRLRLPEMVDHDGGGKRPYFIRLSRAARAAWADFADCHAAEVNADDFADHLEGPWAKMRGYCGRLALVVHYLRWAAGEFDDDKADADDRDVLRATALVNYFKGHARRVYASIDADSRLAGARKVLGWIFREKCQEFKRWQAHKDLESDAMFPTPESLDPALELLERHNYVRAVTPVRKSNRGRLPDDVYLVHPAAGRENRVNRKNGEEGP